MENGTLVAAGGQFARGPRMRVSAVVAAVALVFAALILVQHRADAAPSTAAVTAAVALPAVDAPAAQIDIRQFVCPILLAIRNAFAGSPFFSFVVAALDPILVAFGCLPSPG